LTKFLLFLASFRNNFIAR